MKGAKAFILTQKAFTECRDGDITMSAYVGAMIPDPSDHDSSPKLKETPI